MEKKWWTLIAVCVGTFMYLLDITIINVALPDIQHGLHASFSDLQWVVDAYALALAALLLSAGSTADRYGRRLLFTIGLVVFTLGSLLCGLATSPLFLILARVFQGVGGSALFATSLALLAQTFQGRERGVAFGAWGTTSGVAVASGPILGGIITTGLSWRWIFLVNVPIGVAAVVLTLARVEESRNPNARRLDLPGFGLFSLALASLVFGLIEADRTSWTDGLVLTSFTVAVVLLVVFVMVEQRSVEPMFDLTLFRNPTFVGAAVAAFGLSAGIFAMLLYLVLYLQNVLNCSALGAGLRLAIISGAILVTASITGRLTTRMPVKLLIGPGMLLVGLGLWLMAGIGASTGWTHLILGFILTGIGIGMVNPPLASTAVGVVHPRNAGVASGINSTFRQVGTATGIAGLGSIFGSAVTSRITAGVSRIPGLGATPRAVATAIKDGATSSAIAAAPSSDRLALARLATSSFVHGLNVILIVGAVLSVMVGLASLVLIRGKDFEPASGSSYAAAPSGAAAPTVR